METYGRKIKDWRKNMKKSILLLCIGIFLLSGVSVYAQETKTVDDERLVEESICEVNTSKVVERVVSDEEFIWVLAENKQISYEEAEKMLLSEKKETRASSESVVVIHRTVYENSNYDYKLRCSAYLEVVRDNVTGDYLEILEIYEPHVDFEGETINTTINGNAEGKVLTGKKKAVVYFNGIVDFAVSYSISTSVSLPGVSIGGSVGNTQYYRYDTNEEFYFVI